MATSADLITLLPKEVSDDSTNGGRASASIVVSGQLQNVFPHVPKAERLAGSTKWRKTIDRFANDADEVLIGPGYYFDGDTLAEDWATFAPVGPRSTQADWTSLTIADMFGAGYLKTAVLATDTALTLVMKDASIVGAFRDTMEVRVSDKPDPDSVSGNEVFLTVSGTPGVSSNEVTLTFSTQIGEAFDAGTGTKVSGVYRPGGDLQTVIDNVVVTSSAGTFDDLFVELDNIGTFEQTVTITFISATAFTVASDDVEVTLASGDITTEYSPQNPDWSKPYFTIPTGAWGGTFAAADTVVFQTHSPDIHLAQKRIVPAGAASLANNRIRKVTIGESAT